MKQIVIKAVPEKGYDLCNGCAFDAFHCHNAQKALLLAGMPDCRRGVVYARHELDLTHWMPLPAAPKMEGGE